MSTTTYTALQHPVLILIRGIPGSGKTYLAAELQKAFGADAVVMLDPDAIDFDSQTYKDHVAAQPTGDDARVFPFRFLQNQAYQGIQDHKLIIWNQPFTQLEMFGRMIGRLQAQAAEHNTSLPILVVEVEIDPEVAKARMDQRIQNGGHGPSDNTFGARMNEYVTVANDGYNVLTVRGDDDVTASATSVVNRVTQLLQ